jgi:hypothetical protein
MNLKIKNIAIICAFFALPGSAVADSKTEILKPIPIAFSSPEAEVILGKAVLSATVAELEKRKYPENGNQFRSMTALQNKLFNDDFNFAAYFDPMINPEDLERTRSSIMADLKSKNVEELKRNLEGVAFAKRRADVSLPEKNSLSQWYLRLIGSKAGVRIAEANRLLAPLKGNLLRSDFFKDACVYAGLNSEVDRFISLQRQFEEEILEMADPQNVKPGERESIAPLTDNTIHLMEMERSSIHAIFSFRFTQIHGLEEGEIFAALAKVGVSGNDGPIDIPAP